MKQPTVYVTIGEEHCTIDEGGEVISTTETIDGAPDWTQAGVCDPRGGGGAEGFKLLYAAIHDAERNAALVGLDIERVVQPS